MRILLTGSTGYIGRRLLPVLLEEGHTVICVVRDQRRFNPEDFSPADQSRIEVVDADLSVAASLESLPVNIDAAYYLVHSMSNSLSDFRKQEKAQAENFINFISRTNAKQVVYLGGIVNDSNLSEHLTSRLEVEEVLGTRAVPLTVLRAAIIIGSGSASFEIIRDLVEKLPLMIAPKWLRTKCQPIGIRNVIEYLRGVLLCEETYSRVFDIGGKDILSYHQMLSIYAKVRGLRRWIIPVPVLSPKLSSLWLYFVTSTSISLARSLVSSLRNEVICKEGNIQKIVPVKVLSYEESLQLAFQRIQQRNVISSWIDAANLRSLNKYFLNQIEVPVDGCFQDRQVLEIPRSVKEVTDNIWKIGGDNGWYFGNWLWRARGVLDKTVGGVGLRRGRRSPTELKPGDSLDFWRVLVADKTNARLLLYAEMKLPGEAWLEFRVRESEGKTMFHQTATFRPLGVWGRLYWYSVLPFHVFVFPGMARRIVGSVKKIPS